MGAIGGLTGTAGGVNGTGISGPNQATIQQGTSAQDVQKSQKTTGNTLADQHALLAALQNQNGLGRQTDVASQQQALANQMSAANGVGTQNQAIQGLQGTAGMYQNIASGQGPNPAMAALNQATGQNVANQAALMAGQRGAGSNAGLLARQAAQQGAATQQQSVGQGATMQAQQQLNALSGLSGAQQAIGGLGSTQVGQQQGQQAAQANMANQIAGQQIGQVNNNAAASMQNQQSMQNALAGINSAKVSSMGSVNAANAALANTNMQGQQAMIGGAMQGMGGAASSMMGAEGGQVKKMADGGSLGPEAPWQSEANAGQSMQSPNQEAPWQAEATAGQSMPAASPAPAPAAAGPQSGFGQAVNAPAPAPEAKDTPLSFNPAQQGYGSAKLEAGAKAFTGAGADFVKGLMSEVKNAAGAAAMAAEGGLADEGGHVAAKNPNQKAVADGDDYSNDKIPAQLSEGEIVLPRSVTMSDDPIKAAGEFVAKTLAERKSIPKKNFDEGGEAVPAFAPAPDASPQSPQAPPVVDPAAGAAQAPVASPVMPAPEQQPMQQPQDQGQASPQQPSPNSSVDEIIKVNHDFATGKVKPETYSDLWADKQTPGKLGTLFGLLVGGMGSGLTHQPNVVLQMMDKQIDRDLAKQKEGTGNVQSFLGLAQDLRAKQIANATNEAVGERSAALAGAGITNLQNPTLDKYHAALNDKGNTGMAKAYAISAWLQDVRNKNLNNPQMLQKIDEFSKIANQHILTNATGAQDAYNAADKVRASDQAAPQNTGGSSVLNEAALNKAMVNPGGLTGQDAINAGLLDKDTAKQVTDEINNTKIMEQDKKDYKDIFGELKNKKFGGESGIAKIADAITGGSAHASSAGAADSFLSRDRQLALARLQQKYGDLSNYFPGINDLSPEKKARALANGLKFFDQQLLKSHQTIDTLNKNNPKFNFLMGSEKPKNSPAKKAGSAKNVPAAKKEAGFLDKIESFMEKNGFDNRSAEERESDRASGKPDKKGSEW